MYMWHIHNINVNIKKYKRNKRDEEEMIEKQTQDLK